MNFTPVTKTSSNVVREYSICSPPALQTEISTLLKCWPVAQFFRMVGAALSIAATTVKSLKLTLPAPPPPPLVIEPGCSAPQSKLSMLVQSLWLESFDSPFTPSTFMNISIAIFYSPS